MAKFTKVTKKTFLEMYKKNNGSIKNACETIGISRTCYYKALDKDEKFKQAIEEINQEFDEELIISAKEGLRYNLRMKKQSAIEYTLNNKCKKEFSNTVKQELSGKDGVPLSITLNEVIYENPSKKDA